MTRHRPVIENRAHEVALVDALRACLGFEVTRGKRRDLAAQVFEFFAHGSAKTHPGHVRRGGWREVNEMGTRHQKNHQASAYSTALAGHAVRHAIRGPKSSDCGAQLRSESTASVARNRAGGIVGALMPRRLVRWGCNNSWRRAAIPPNGLRRPKRRRLGFGLRNYYNDELGSQSCSTPLVARRKPLGVQDFDFADSQTCRQFFGEQERRALDSGFDAGKRPFIGPDFRRDRRQCLARSQTGRTKRCLHALQFSCLFSNRQGGFSC